MLVQLFVSSSEPTGPAPGPKIPGHGARPPTAWLMNLASLLASLPAASPDDSPHRVLGMRGPFMTPGHCSQPLLCLGCSLSSSFCIHLLILRGHGLPLSEALCCSQAEWVASSLGSQSLLYQDSVCSRAASWPECMPPWQGQVYWVSLCTELAPGPKTMSAQGRRVVRLNGWQLPTPLLQPHPW